eukprot:TRINITY_DN3954_c0_g1_i2.p1 TRINITY_DN3954_c0_g1~~TRINITY_DN3954_c0_g1_i2.p1  ORF type:complete len:290 (+),score=59.54 TRINITY_DN3954_c0_g1_i2:854-1723(+)
MMFYETSAKTGEQIEEAFTEFAKTLISWDAKLLPVDIEALQGKSTMEDMKIKTKLIKNEKFTETDMFGIAHFYPQQQFGDNYQKYCCSWQPSLSNKQIISIVNQYTDRKTELCTKINLLLASDSQQLEEQAKEIKQLRFSIYTLSSFYPVKVNKVFRGMDGSEKEYNNYPLDKFIYLPSFTSTSKNPNKFYSNKKQNTILIINFKSIPSNAFAVTKKYSKNAEDDEEVLFACYSKFKVIKKDTDIEFQGKLFKFYIELEAVNQNSRQSYQNVQNLIVPALMFNNFIAIN